MSARASTSLLEGATRLRCISGRGKHVHEIVATRQMRTIARARASSAEGEEHTLASISARTKSSKDAYSLEVRGPGASGSNAAVSELQKRFTALDQVLQEEVEMAQQEPDELPEFSEAELLGFYEDVLTLPQVSSTDSASSTTLRAIPDGDSRIQTLADTFAPSTQASSEPNFSSSSTLSVLQQRLESSPPSSVQLQDVSQARNFPELQALPAYQRVIYRLKQTVPELAQIRQKAAPGSVPIVLLTMGDWTSLVQTCMKHNDLKSAEDVLGLMKMLEGEKVAESATDVMAYYAKRGDVANTERLLQTYQAGTPTERQRDIHVQAHIHSTPRNSMPESALALVHDYETQNAPIPLATYNSVITNLFNEARSSVATAQAWDLYGHMRYVAHPTPDASLYATMIRACAPANGQPEPERALDLFTEMTVDNALEPTQAVYNAVIYACARSGSQAYVSEAFRLARQMLDARKDARGLAQFRANADTFAALLEGAKRRGDLARTRWILAELVGEVNRAREGAAPPVIISDETMVHVFHAYAAYRPPRVQVRNIPDAPAPEPTQSPASPTDAAARNPGPSSSSIPAKRSAAASRAHLPPQSRGEVLREAQTIFERVVGEVKARTGPFSTVHISPKLIDAYLAVHFVHGKLADAARLFDSLFAEYGVRRGPRALVGALERCAISRTGEDREAAIPFAASVWAEWEKAEEDAARRGRSLNPRLVEQAHVAIVRTHALANDIPRALGSIRAFVARYPPANMRVPGAQPDYRSSRTRLEGARPLVRLTPATDVADDSVPPQLTWADLEVVHHRCVAAGRADGIRYIKWVCHAYRGALKTRREKFLGIEDDIKQRRREKEREEREVLDIVQGSMQV